MENERNPEIRSNCALDLLRLACAVGVVTVHSISSNTSSFNALINMALHVPPLVFFLLSGYFWRGTRGTFSAEHARKTFVRTLKMTVFWVIAYMLFTGALVYPFHGRVPGMDSTGEWFRSFFSVENLGKMLLLQRAPGTGAHLWYLMALVAAQLLMWAIYSLRWTRIRLPLAIALLACQMLVQWAVAEYAVSIGQEGLRNVWLTGLPWMMVGDWLRGRESAVRRIPTAVLAIVGVGGLFTLPLETWWHGSAEYTVGLYLAAPALVMLGIKLGTNVDRPWARPMRAFTLPLYLWHMLFVMPMVTAVIVLGLSDALRWLIPPVTILLCWAIFRLKKRLLARRAAR